MASRPAVAPRIERVALTQRYVRPEIDLRSPGDGKRHLGLAAYRAAVEVERDVDVFGTRREHDSRQRRGDHDRDHGQRNDRPLSLSHTSPP